MPLNADRGPAAGATCADCRSKKHNRQVYHILKFDDLDSLKEHLHGVFPGNDFCREFFVNLWLIAHQLYGHIAKDKYAPLWLIYLEAQGVKVTNRAEAIMGHRGINPKP